MGITVQQLYSKLARLIVMGQGDKTIQISSDDECNHGHTLFGDIDDDPAAIQELINDHFFHDVDIDPHNTILLS